MRRRTLLIGVAIAIVVVVSISLAALARLDVNQYRAQIQAAMQQRLGRNVTLGNLKLTLIPPRLRVENLQIAEASDFGGTLPFLKAENADLSVRLLPLLSNRIEISRIRVKRPDVEIVKNANGVWNFSSLLQGRPQMASGSGNGVILKGNLDLIDGQIAVTDLQRKGSRKVYDHIDMALRDFAPGKPFSIDATARISSQGGQRIGLHGTVGPLFTGKLDLNRVAIDGLRNFLDVPALANTNGIVSGETDIKTDDGKLAASGSLRMENVRINGIDVGYPITFRYNLTGDPATNVVTIAPSTIGLGATPIAIRGSVNLDPTPAELSLDADFGVTSVKEVTRLASALGVAFAPGATVTGQMSGALQIRGAYNNPTMNGTVASRDLHISGKDVPQPVRIAAVDLAISPAEIRSNNFEVRSGNTTAAARFSLARYTSTSPSIDFVLRALNASLPDILTMARAYGVSGLSGISGAGTLSLDVHASGPVRSMSSSAIMRLLNGTANMDFNNLIIAGLDVEHELKSIGGFGKSSPDRGGTDIRHLTGHFTLNNGIARTNNLKALLNIGTVAAAGTANLSSHALNLRATAVISPSAIKEAAGGSFAGKVQSMLANAHGEFVVPGTITGTFERPVFAPDTQQLTVMQLKGIVPTSDNPFGVLGQLFKPDSPSDSPDEARRPSQNPAKGVGKAFDKIFGKRK